MFLAIFSLILLPQISLSAEFEVTSGNLCEVCQCGPGPGMNPKEKAVCQNVGEGKQIRVASLPHYVTSLVVENSSGGVVIMRGVIRVNNEGANTFWLTVTNSSHLDVSEKSINLLGPASEAHVTIKNIENVNFNGKAIHASKPGSFFLHVTHCGTVSIDSRSFDVLNEANFDHIQTLRLSTGALKPNIPLENPEMKISIRKINSIPQLPTDAFSSAASIVIVDCKISEIESGAFSGFSVNTISFLRTSINRVHSRAFPEKSLVNRLSFENCSLTSVGEKAISSAISSLEITNSTLSSLSEEAVFSHVAKVEFSHNNFQTLSHRLFVLQSWNEIDFSNNRIMFMETGSIVGIDVPGEADSGSNVTFVFKQNHIHYANKDALKLVLPSSVDSTIEDNLFYKYCECGIEQWLTVVCGGAHTNSSLLDMVGPLGQTSRCQVPEMSRPCFHETLVRLSVYSQKFCLVDSQSDNDNGENLPTCMLTSQLTILDLILQHLEVNSNRGILLVLLVFALACSLVVAILTLFRWIIYTIRAKAKCHNKSQEWNFTKIEEKSRDPSGSQHYESLPLTGATGFDSSPATGQSQGEHPTSLSVESEEEDETEDVDKICPATETTHTTLETEAARCKSPPKPTFYDEMICLLQEKLDDPNNYGTVADSQTTCFYQDPHDKLEK